MANLASHPNHIDPDKYALGASLADKLHDHHTSILSIWGPTTPRFVNMRLHWLRKNRFTKQGLVCVLRHQKDPYSAVWSFGVTLAGELNDYEKT